MYNNIGKKIKGLALGFFIVEALAAIIGAIALIADDEDLIPIGLLMIIFGPLVAWVSSWMLYGFGELIDKTSDIARNTAPTAAKYEIKSEPQPKVDTARIERLNKLLEQGLITEEEYRQAADRLAAAGRREGLLHLRQYWRRPCPAPRNPH